jgi:hypothetical protein
VALEIFFFEFDPREGFQLQRIRVRDLELCPALTAAEHFADEEPPEKAHLAPANGTERSAGFETSRGH